MLAIAQRLWLGTTLIGLVSAILLLSDSGARPGSSGTPAHRKWKVNILAFITAADSEDCQRGMREGLAASLKEGEDYEVVVRNAQGDMPTLSSLVDAAMSDGADLIMTLSTPTLQAAVQRVKSIPIVFSFSSNPIGAGTGKSYTDHLPNVTGVATTGAYAEIIQIIRETLPGARRLGSLLVPSEVNSVYNTEQVKRVAEAAGLELVSVAVSSSSEISDAALGLLARQVDAICQVPSNLTITGFASISRPAQRARVPVFGFLTSEIENGAVAVAARDYFESGKAAGALAARVIRGESPATLQFEEVGATKIMVNKAAAQAIGLTIPPSLLGRAVRVLE